MHRRGEVSVSCWPRWTWPVVYGGQPRFPETRLGRWTGEGVPDEELGGAWWTAGRTGHGGRGIHGTRAGRTVDGGTCR